MSFIKKLVLVLTLVLTGFLTLACGEEATLKFEKNSFEVTVGESFELKPIITGSESLVEYSFDKEGIVKVENQTVSALAAGDVVITATLKDAKDVKATITVTVKEKVIEHTHAFDKEVVDAKYLATEATCTAKATYYKSCSCGEKGTETFEAGDLAAHVFDKEVVDAKYLATEATCTAKATYYKSCVCGEKGTETFESGDLAAHVFDKEVVDPKYLAEEATTESAAKYYKSCVCGEKGTETFSHGDPLPPTEIKAEKVEILNKIEEALFGDELELEIKVTPENTTDQIEITASDDAVEFDGNLVILNTTGKVTITVKCGDVVDSFEIMLYDMVTDVTVKFDAIYANIGDVLTPTISVFPETAKQGYEVSFDVEGLLEKLDGSFKAIASGTVKVIATSTDGSETSGEFELQIYEVVESIKLTGDTVMFAEKEQQLKHEFTAKFPYNKAVTWNSSDTSVATVDENGLVKALKPGTVTITCATAGYGDAADTIEITIKEAPKASDNVYVASNVANMEVGATVVVEGITFVVGTTAFSSMKDAIEVCTGTLYVGAGEYEDAITISKSNLQILGPNYAIAGNSEDRVAEAKILGVITMAEGVTNVSIKGFTFVGAARVLLGNNNDGIELSYSILDGTSGDGVIDAIDSNATTVSNIKFNYNYSNNYTGNRVIRFAGVTNLEALYNDITCTQSYDFVNASTYIAGEVNISYNTYVNSLQSFIYSKGVKAINAVIEHNNLENIANTGIDFRDMKDANASAKFVIRFNTLNNAGCGWCPIRIRTAGYSSTNSISIEISYNKFIESYYADGEIANFIENPSLSSQSDPFKKIYVVGRNYYVVKGEVFTDLTDVNFTDAAISYEEAFATAEEIDNATVYGELNSSDETVLIVGTNSYVTKTTYETLAAALAVAKEGYTIYLLPGAHTGDAKITIDDLTITTLNGNKNPNKEVSRFEEATYNGKLTLGKGLANFTISGIKFVEGAKIVNSLGDKGTASATTKNLKGFFFKNNIVNVALTSGNGFIEFAEAASCYSHDIQIINNHFAPAETNATKAVVYVDNNYNLVLENNVFENIKGDAFYVVDTTKGLSGEFSRLNSNTFINITGTAMHINWLSALPLNSKTCEVEIQNNTFEHIGNNAIYLGKMNNSDVYAALKVMFNKFTDVKVGLYCERVHTNAVVNAKYNVFNDVPSDKYYVNNSKNSETSSPAEIDATLNLFYTDGAIIDPSAEKFSELVKYDPKAGSLEELPSFDGTASAITIEDVNLFVGDTKQLEVVYTPSNITNIGVSWVSSDESIAKIDESGKVTALKEGNVTITAIYKKNTKIIATKEIEVKLYKSVELSFEGNSLLTVGDFVQINHKLINLTGTVKFESSNKDVATVDANGLLTALTAGDVVITASVEGTDYSTKLYFTVEDVAKEYSELMQLLIDSNNSVVFYDTVNYIGYETGYTSVPHNVYGSVNAFWNGVLPETVQRPLDTNAPNYDGRTMKSVEFIVVHDTGAASPTSTALANSKWCTNSTNSNSSWHYTIGNDGVYQQLPDNIIAWHAGDGASWGNGTTEWFDTGIAYEGDRPTVTIGDDGYFYINGKKSLVESPRKSDGTVEKRTNTLGILCVKGENGNYKIPTTHIGSGYSNVVCVRGGNYNGIGIETAVNTGSDVYYTWQYTAKFVAELLIKHNLLPDRISFHNNFSNKTCPNTMITNNLVDMFLRMAYTEYEIAKNYSDYQITFESNNPEIIDNEGRIVNAPEFSTNVSYKITITKDGVSESVTLQSVVPGTKTLG